MESEASFQLVPMQQLLEEIGLFASETFPRNIKVDRKYSSRPLAGECEPESDPSGAAQSLFERAGCNARWRHTYASRGELSSGSGGRSENRGRPPWAHFLCCRIDDTGTGFSPAGARPHVGAVYHDEKGGQRLGVGTTPPFAISSGITKDFIELRYTAPARRGTSFRIYLPAAGTSRWENVRDRIADKLRVRPLICSHLVRHAERTRAIAHDRG